jgi:hypothetical protein
MLRPRCRKPPRTRPPCLGSLMFLSSDETAQVEPSPVRSSGTPPLPEAGERSRNFTRKQSCATRIDASLPPNRCQPPTVATALESAQAPGILHPDPLDNPRRYESDAELGENLQKSQRSEWDFTWVSRYHLLATGFLPIIHRTPTGTEAR